MHCCAYKQNIHGDIHYKIDKVNDHIVKLLMTVSLTALADMKCLSVWLYNEA